MPTLPVSPGGSNSKTIEILYQVQIRLKLSVPNLDPIVLGTKGGVTPYHSPTLVGASSKKKDDSKDQSSLRLLKSIIRRRKGERKTKRRVVGIKKQKRNETRKKRSTCNDTV